MLVIANTVTLKNQDKMDHGLLDSSVLFNRDEQDFLSSAVDRMESKVRVTG